MEHKRLFGDSSSIGSYLRSSNKNLDYHLDKKGRSTLHNQRSSGESKHDDKLYGSSKLDNKEYENCVEEQLLAAEEKNDVEKTRDESRKRRQVILDKYKNKRHQRKVEVEQTQGGVEDNSIATTDEKIKNALNENSTNDNASHYNALGHGLQEKGNPEHSSETFCNDMFAKSPVGGWRVQKSDKLAITSSGLCDNWDDAQGRYRFQLGEILDGRYHILESLGSGVFSTVIKAHDSEASENRSKEVAIKIIRNNDTMYKSGLNEVKILKKLGDKDAKNKKHCVQLLSSFEYRNHLCLVFESSHMNLRKILNKYGRNIGINLMAVRAYARQICIALQHLQNCGVLHCDIKLDNILVNDSMDARKSNLKLCDFGSSMLIGENEATPYLVSRYYRAPEIILGVPYNHALDIWSVACCLYELYSGEMLFPGNTNHEMLQLQMKLMGAFPKKMLRKAMFQKHHFDHDLNFCAMGEDDISKQVGEKMIRTSDCFVELKGMRHLVMNLKKGSEKPELVALFIDLLMKMLVLDPSKRMTVAEALNHPFILK